MHQMRGGDFVYLVQSNYIRRLPKEQFEALVQMCRYANSLYNVALYNIRQFYFNEKKYLSYESNYPFCKENENYRMLQAGVAQQTLKVADRNFKSFFALLKKAKKGEYNFSEIEIPHYHKKGGLMTLVLSTNAINIKDGYITIPISRAFNKHYSGGKIRVPFPEHLADKTIKEVRIVPLHDGRCFKVQYVYEAAFEPVDVDPNNKLSIDLGVDNLAACISTLGTSFLVDGRKLKSINQGWNKRKAYLQARADEQGLKTTKRLDRIADKRNNQVKDAMRKAARHIVNHCIDNRIGTMVVGYNPEIKRRMYMGKRNNQTFAYISFGDFRQQLQCLCERYGIAYIEQEESYTSKASFLDLDDIPVYQPGEHSGVKFSGRRVHRGLYKSKNGLIVNADLNGAANILRKSKQNFDYEKLCSGLLASPCRVRLF